MLSNQKAIELAESYSKQVQSELGDDLLFVLLFGSTIEGKPFPNDVDVLVCGKNQRPNIDAESINLAYYNLDQIKDLVQGKGQGDPNFLRRVFMGKAKTLYDPKGYYLKINRAFASECANFID